MKSGSTCQRKFEVDARARTGELRRQIIRVACSRWPTVDGRESSWDMRRDLENPDVADRAVEQQVGMRTANKIDIRDSPRRPSRQDTEGVGIRAVCHRDGSGSTTVWTTCGWDRTRTRGIRYRCHHDLSVPSTATFSTTYRTILAYLKFAHGEHRPSWCQRRTPGVVFGTQADNVDISVNTSNRLPK